jgi:hypothetical protein
MTSKEFVIWLNGFVEACHEYAPTPKQWDALKDKLAEVKDDISVSPFPFGIPNNTPMWQEPHKVNPFYVGDVPLTNPLGQSSITLAKPQFVTSTATSLPEGTTVSYTTKKPHNED